MQEQFHEIHEIWWEPKNPQNVTDVFFTKDFLHGLNFTHVLKCRYNITDIIRLSHLETEIFSQLVCRRYASRKTRRMNLSGLILWIPVLYIDSLLLIPAWGQRMTVTKDIGPSFGSCINITMKKIFTRISLLLVRVSVSNWNVSWFIRIIQKIFS